MARYTLVYGIRIVKEGTLVDATEGRLTLKDGETAGLTLHTIDGTIPQLRRALDRSLDAFFDFLPGATDEDREASELWWSLAKKDRGDFPVETPPEERLREPSEVSILNPDENPFEEFDPFTEIGES